MSNSAWDEKVVIKGSGIAEGTYEVVLKDILRENKVVMFREGLRGNKGIFNKEYETLTAEQKAIVDAAGDEFWPVKPTDKDQTPRKKAAFADQYRFVFVEPKSGQELKSGAVFQIEAYDAAGNVMPGVVGKTFTDFVARATGVPVNVGDELKLSDFFKAGDAYVLDIITKNNYKEIDPKSVVKKELAKPIVKGVEALSERAKTLLEFLKANYQGRPKRDILELYGSGQFGSYQETTSAWQEIMKNVKYTTDNKTLDFSEA